VVETRAASPVPTITKAVITKVATRTSLIKFSVSLDNNRTKVDSKPKTTMVDKTKEASTKVVAT